MSDNLKNIFKTTKDYLVRNKWLSIATVIVTSIVFATSSFFIIASLVAHRSVKVAETNAQLEIYFQLNTPESEIMEVKELVENSAELDKIDYISQEEALELYLSYYSDDPNLVDNVSADWLPASLEVRATSLAELEKLKSVVEDENDLNPYIEEVDYHEDALNQLKILSTAITFGGGFVIFIFAAISLALVYITISFNIMAHKKEIQIMQLVGSSDRNIRLPFIVEGTIYTALGATFAASSIFLPWYLFAKFGEGSNFYFIVEDILTELSLATIMPPTLTLTLLFFLIHLIIGSFIGLFSSSLAVARYLNLEAE
jgi:cell division transport system permease protein